MLMWLRLHVDAAFAGVYAVLPELRHHFDGLDGCDSFSTNAHKVRNRAVTTCVGSQVLVAAGRLGTSY